jgi:hypothetical protein
MIELVYVPYEQYRAAKTRCGLDSRLYGILGHTHLKLLCIITVAELIKYGNIFLSVHEYLQVYQHSEAASLYTNSVI